jgi:hypothetical protein
MKSHTMRRSKFLPALITASMLISFLSGAQLRAADTKYPKTLEQYEMIRTGLVADDLAAAKNGATNLTTSAREELGDTNSKALAEGAQNLASSATIKDARASFQVISNEMAKLVKGEKGFYLMTCPMLKDSLWVQTTPKIGNPYQGKAMAECGDIKEKF